MARIPRLARRWHRLGAIVTALPFLVVIATGLLLQMKKDWGWVQPPTQRGAMSVPSLPHAELLEVVRRVPEAEVASWADIDRLDVRPSKGVVKVRCQNGVEVQLDGASGAVLQVAKRRSDWLESLHDGSWFHPWAKLGLFLPVGLVILFLWISGVYLWWLPHSVRRRKRLRQKNS
ncbi:MAG: PepSY domain-containing protein [Planctomycetota bacterium]